MKAPHSMLLLCGLAALVPLCRAGGDVTDPLQKTSLCGGMTPVRSQWIKFGEDAIVLRVDTTRCAFEGAPVADGPCYFASIVEAHHGTFIPGTVSLTQTSESHFTLMMWDPSQSSAVMLDHAADWLVSWVGAVGTRCSTTAAGATGWKLGEAVGTDAVAVYADVDTTGGGFTKTPTYLVSTRGLWDIESPKALLGVFTNIVHEPTPRGFRVYIVVAEAPGVFKTQREMRSGSEGEEEGGAAGAAGVVPKALQKAAEHADSYHWRVSWLGVEEDGATEMADAARKAAARGSGEAPRWFSHGHGADAATGAVTASTWHDDPRFERDTVGEAEAAVTRRAAKHGAVFAHVDVTAARYNVIPAFVASVATARRAFACVGAQVISAPTPRGFNLYLGRLTVRWGTAGTAGRSMGCGVPSRDSEDRERLRVNFVGYRVAGLGDTAATGVAAGGGGCAHVRLHGQPKGELMANRMGSYAKQEASYNSHPVYMMESARWGKAFLYFDFTPDGKTFWVVGPKVGSNAVNVYSVSHRHFPDRVEGQWMVADPSHNTFAPAPRVECDCGLAVVPPRLGQCEDLLLTGQLKSFPMFHRMGLYTLQAEQYNDRPVYRNITKKWGAAYLYYDRTADGKKFWVVGPKVGSSGVNLYAADAAAVPDRISVDWMVADPADNTFVASARIEATCQKNARFGFGDLAHFGGKMLRVDAGACLPCLPCLPACLPADPPPHTHTHTHCHHRAQS
jgi:hypothetical protein